MPYNIVRNDIVNMKADAIVNTANPKPIIGSGTDSAIHEAAGPELLKARKMIGSIERGKSAITPAFGLNAKYVIHTIGPKWIDGRHHEAETLRSAYESALTLAVDFNCKSIAFPLMAAGSYGFPKELAIQIATKTFEDFLYRNPDMKIYLVLFNKDAYELSGRMFRDIQSFIDDNYANSKEEKEYPRRVNGRRRFDQSRFHEGRMEDIGPDLDAELPEPEEESISPDKCMRVCSSAPLPLSPAMSAPSASQRMPDKLGDYIQRFSDKDTFAQAMFKIIDEKGWTDPEVYKRTNGNVSRQTMSKLRGDPSIRPRKNTAVMLCIALHLSLSEANSLLARAGYTLSENDLSDVIVMYFLERQEYSLIAIDNALYDYNLPTLNKSK